MWLLGWSKRGRLRLKKGQFRVVINMDKKGQFRVVNMVVKKGQIRVVITVV